MMHLDAKKAGNGPLLEEGHFGQCVNVLESESPRATASQINNTRVGVVKKNNN